MKQMTQQTIIKLKDLTKYYYKDQKLLFHNVNLEINNEIHAIVGPNGSGKTVLLKMLVGLEKLTKGEILILDANGFYNTIKKPKDMHNLKVVYVGQDDSFDENLTVKQNVILGFEKTKFYFFTSIKESEFKIKELTEKFKIKLNLDKFVCNLTVEERKKLALLWALFKEPKILLLDEPTSGLSMQQKYDFWLTFKLLREQNFTIIFTTKDEEFAKTVAHRVSWIKKTRIINTEVNKLKSDIKEFNHNPWKGLIDYQKPKPENKVPLLHVTDFSLNDEQLQNFFGLEFAVRPGEIYGIYDYENLYGQVLTDSLVGIIKNVKKRIWFEEKEITSYNWKKFAKLNINWIPTQSDKNAVLNDDNLLTNFMLWNHNNPKYVMKSGIIKRFEVKNQIIGLEKKYKIPNTNKGSILANQLSKGELQQFVLAKILEEKPKLLILTNPFSNLDRSSAKIIIRQLLKLIKKDNAILIIDNDPFILELLAQRVAILYHKKFVAKMIGNQVKANHLLNSSNWIDYPLTNETFIISDKMQQFRQSKWFLIKDEIKRIFLIIFKPFIVVRKWIRKIINKINSRVV